MVNIRVRWVISKRSKILLKAFLLGVILRAIIEICNGEFPVGYDPSAWYVLMCVCEMWDYASDAPLYPIFLYLLYRAIGNVLIAIKIGSVLVSGFFTFSTAYWAIKYGVKEDHVLRFVAFTYTFFVILRILWDLHRNVVGISLSLLALAFYKEGKDVNAFILSVLAGLGHPYSAIFIGAGILYELLVMRKMRAVILASGVLIGASIVILTKMILWNFPMMEIFESYWYVSRAELPLYILWLYAPVIPIILMILHKRPEISRTLILNTENRKLLTWIFAILTAAFVFEFTYRITFLAAYPLLAFIFMLINGLHDRRRIYKLLILYNITISAIYPAIFYIYPIRDSFRKTVPPALVGGNGFPWQLEAAKQLFRKALEYLDESSAIIVHHAEASCAYAAGVPLNSHNVLVTHPDDDFERYLNLAKQRGFHVAYIVWYITAPVGSIEAPPGGFIIESVYDLALYKYTV
ncbi:MAG: hypothetical protein NDP13_01630 [Crenarchaeota archaeon]|nr:hypothetical protein [Thermoproteota archaeon]